MSDEPLRPDPDRLLQHTAAPHRGKLKVFFGACAGVGKTWAMLAEAQRLRAQGLDILIGVAETHGRKETAAMLQGLSTLPPRRLAHRGRYVYEFDLDAALARRPALILVDELAHSNAPGSRHPKRWQDVDELLEAGIDVFTTVNVQHLESLNDVVSGITGVQVRETVPDPFFDAADDVVLVDLPPDDLRQLMIPEQQRLLETFTLLVASALERLTLTASEEQARLTSERESLRNSLLAALSHDLRTPLTVLFGQAEILTLDLASEGSKHAPQANEIRQHVLNTTRLVNNLLDMARIQSGGFNLHKEWLTLEEVVGSALRMLEPSLGGQHIQLDLPDPLQLVHVDGPLFERVLINLLENAHKYAGARASIGIRAEADARQLSLEVWDNGPGIPAGQEQTIFDKFARGNKESAIPGVGLGLAICQAIVDVHGGTISASNRPEGGASFRVTLPGETPPELEELPEEL